MIEDEEDRKSERREKQTRRGGAGGVRVETGMGGAMSVGGGSLFRTVPKEEEETFCDLVLSDKLVKLSRTGIDLCSLVPSLKFRP